MNMSYAWDGLVRAHAVKFERQMCKHESRHGLKGMRTITRLTAAEISFGSR